MWTRIGLALAVLLSGVAPAFADGFVETSGTYADGAQIRGNRYDVNGALKVTQATLTSCEDQTNNLCMTSGGAVRSTTMASAVTTNTISAAVALPVGSKSIYGSVAGTGAVTQTQAIWSGLTSGFTPTVAGGGVLLCTIVLSGTTFTGDQCPVITAPGLFYKVVTTNTTGTSASGTVTAMY